MKTDIDAVIAYVNCEDKVWQQEFSQYNNCLTNDVQNGFLRYRDAGTFPLVIESIRKFAPWVNKIHLIVAYESQVPSFIDKDINIIYHRDFVPKEYLPMFNACALEIFFPFLDGVANHFLYFNDDMILTSPITKDVFFNSCDNPYSTISISKRRKHENRTLVNNYNLLIGQEQELYEGYSIHGPSAFRKDWMIECYNKYEEKLLEKISPQRRTMYDYSQYVYQLYQLIYKNCEYKEFPWKCLYNKLYTYKQFDWSTLGDYVGVCLNASDIAPYVKLVAEHIKQNHHEQA